MNLEYHPIVNVFPRMSDDELTSFSESIRQCGVEQPVTIWKDSEGKYWLIDGRHRYEESEKHGLGCPTKEFVGTEEDAINFAIRQNRERRHLTPSQKAMAAAETAKMLEEAAQRRKLAGLKQFTAAAVRNDDKNSKNTEKSPLAPNGGNGLHVPYAGGRASEIAAKAHGASTRSTERAKEVLDKAHPDIHAAIKAGLVKVSDAKALIGREQDKARQAKALEIMRSGKAISLVQASKVLKAEEIAAKNPPSDDNPIMDEEGNPVPKQIAHLFEHVAVELKAYHNAAMTAKRLLSGFDTDPIAGQYMTTNALRQTQDHLDKAIKELWVIRPYAICPAIRANHEGCPHCDGKLWITKFKFDLNRDASRHGVATED